MMIDFRVGASGVLNSSVVPSSRQDSIRSGYMSDHEALAVPSSKQLQPTQKAQQQVSLDSATGSDARMCYLTSSEVSFSAPSISLSLSLSLPMLCFCLLTYFHRRVGRRLLVKASGKVNDGLGKSFETRFFSVTVGRY